MKSYIYYIMEYIEDNEGEKKNKRIVAKFDKRTTSLKSAFYLWHMDKRNEMSESCDMYIDTCEEESWDDDGSKFILDFTLCADPGHKWCAEAIDSSMNEDMSE